MAKYHDFILEALLGLGAVKLFDDTPVKTHPHGGALRVFNGDHKGRVRVKVSKLKSRKSTGTKVVRGHRFHHEDSKVEGLTS